MRTYLLLAAIAWAVASRGATGGRDLGVVLGLLVVAMIAGGAWPQWDGPRWAAFAGLMCWLLITGLVRTGLTLEAARLPLLVMTATLACLVVRGMSGQERELLVTGLLIVGGLESVLALVQLMTAVSAGLPAPPRSSALLGSPNGLGILLVATSVLAAREVERRGGWVPVTALVLQGSAIVATGSRMAILIGSVLLACYFATHAGWKRGVVATAGLAVAGTVVALRTVADGLEGRPDLWQESFRRIAAHPLIGDGPAPGPFAVASPDARLTTHAHNELLQWGVEYGLVGIGLALVVLVLALRSVGRPVEGERWFQCAALALLLSGLTDFTLRITALTLIAAALTALSIPHQAVTLQPRRAVSPAT